MDIIKIESKNSKYPKRLLKIKNYPNVLYAMGNIELLNSKYTVGIVGSRECTEYGRKVAYNFAKDISKNGICVISGMAIGIDTLAHNGAIEGMGNTIAVLGGGFNYIYPKENEWIFHKILDNGGCVITEYKPDVEPDIKKFPKRNRIISGLSDKILVVEAEYRSGSNITAKYAKAEGKTVYAIPNNIYSSKSLGTNIMIKQGAILTIKAQEIINDLKDIFENIERDIDIQKTRRTNKIESKETIIEKEYLPIYELLSDKPIHINEIARKLNTTIQEISPIITMMEINECAFQIQTNYFVRK